MRVRTIAVYAALVMMGVAAMAGGCTRLSPPSDEDVLAAINRSQVLKGGTFKVVSPLVIVERRYLSESGSWMVKVKMTLTMQMPDGKRSAPKENIAAFKLSKSRDGSGHDVWRAVLTM